MLAPTGYRPPVISNVPTRALPGTVGSRQPGIRAAASPAGKSLTTGLFLVSGLALLTAMTATALGGGAASARDAALGVFAATGALAVLGALAPRLPGQNLALCFGLIAGATAAGAAAAARVGPDGGGLGFGDALGAKMLGLVPWPVPFLAVLILLGGRATARLILLPWRRTRQYGFWLLTVAAVLATVAYLTLDPVARQAGWWRWRVATAGVAWYGRPWFDFLIAFILTAVVLAAVTPWLIAKRPLPRPPDLRPAGLWLGLLLLLVLANARDGAWWAASVGAVVALAGGLMAARNARSVSSRAGAPPPAPA
jgi:hypothetical protein